MEYFIGGEMIDVECQTETVEQEVDKGRKTGFRSLPTMSSRRCGRAPSRVSATSSTAKTHSKIAR
eukprot:4893312-Lingulodinium_polyedra.AAC.1